MIAAIDPSLTTLVSAMPRALPPKSCKEFDIFILQHSRDRIKNINDLFKKGKVLTRIEPLPSS